MEPESLGPWWSVGHKNHHGNSNAEDGRSLMRAYDLPHDRRAVRDQAQWRARLLGGPARSPLDPYRRQPPGFYRWTITRDRRSVASGVAADRDQAANDAAAALGQLPR
jgi:hypothetical protein